MQADKSYHCNADMRETISPESLFNILQIKVL